MEPGVGIELTALLACLSRFLPSSVHLVHRRPPPVAGGLASALLAFALLVSALIASALIASALLVSALLVVHRRLCPRLASSSSPLQLRRHIYPRLWYRRWSAL
ncbi:unnamed protein product [Cuscuta campestris]|uniref:Uncharacterized protein n=1 Tax=Cuscuta campestris TaxID=132261 RepID=A0A484KBL2_9ASTE|nr:unnamed protein product [Cuscuta campestris]